MKRYLILPLLLSCFMLAGCGQQDRTALAQQTVTTYWDDIAHGHIKSAYDLLTTGEQANRPLGAYQQDMLAYLTQVGNLEVKAGRPKLNGDTAVVPVKLFSALSQKAQLNAYQHLFWQNGGWKISDENGGLSHTP